MSRLSGVVPSAVALSLIAALAGCRGETLEEQTSAVIISVPPVVVSTAPRCTLWTSRTTTASLWRTGVGNAIVVIGPSARGRTHFVAYGVDVTNNRLVWVHDIARAAKDDFLAFEGDDFRAASGYDNEHSHIVIGTVHGPGPTPPQPGEPPGVSTINNVLTAGAQIDEAIEASKAAVYE